MRRKIIIGLMVCLWMGMASNAFAFCRDRCFPEQREFEGFCYREFPRRVVIKGYIGTGGSVIIPDTINGKPVTKIAPHAFRGCDNIVDVVIPDSVIRIGNRAFKNCFNLTDVTIGNGVQRIGNRAFANCVSLKTATIGNSVRRIENFAFANCESLECLIIPDSVRVIGAWAFRNCTRLPNVVIGSGVRRIQNGAFWGCTFMTEAYFRGNAPFLGAFVFFRNDPTFEICRTESATGFDRRVLQFRMLRRDIPINICEPECATDDDCPAGYVCECTECVEETLVTLSSFEASWQEAGIVINWVTEAEIDNFGFNIYRAESEAGPFVKINAVLIPAQGVPPGGASYEYTDTTVESGKTYWYELEDIDLYALTMRHGPCGPVSETTDCSYLQ